MKHAFIAVIALALLGGPDFTARAAEVPGDDVARMAAGHAGDRPEPTPAALTPPAQEVVTEKVVYARVGGREIEGYVSRPKEARGNLPGLIVIHEWWGLNDNVRDEARRLAGEGYVTLAVDLFEGASTAEVKEAMRLSTALTENPGPAEENLRQAYAWLEREARAPRIGSIGWCLGGRWSLRTALLLPRELDAAVIYYGSVNVPEAELKTLEMPLIGFFGSRDPVIPLRTVTAFEETMRRLGKQAGVHIYEGAGHGFANPSGTMYKAEAAEDAWRRTVEFLATHLRGPDGA